ncbi:MAG: 3'-5' exonuclease [Bacteroidales bacterium]|nr:3'-5' exonuclease [Bacteroidales bacterium]
MKLNLTRPIVFFDLETTGVQVGSDHIVQICLLKVMPDGSESDVTYLVRPADDKGNTLKIPAESTAIHHITDAMVADKPTFKELAFSVAEYIGDADLAGYNSNKFDVPLLVEEFLRAGVEFSLENRHLVDVQNIFHRMEPRTLVAAYRFYCSKELDGAHSADADTKATYEVLKAQLDRYDGVAYTDRDGKTTTPIVNNIEALSVFTSNPQWADLVGHIGYDKNHREVFNFGKHKGKTLEQVFHQEPAYYDWMMKADFPLSTKQVVMQVQRRIVEEKRRKDQEKLQALKLKFEG